jgi:hypothetical protein
MADVIATDNFERKAKQAGLTQTEFELLVLLLSDRPDAGDLISGAGGARKVRLARQGGGKSGGYRVVTYFGGGELPVYLMTVYA